MPSTTERKARSLACKSPARLGAARVPLIATSAPSEPRSRQPGGASSDQTPIRGNCARSWPLRGAFAGQSQPPTPCPSGARTSRVLSWPSAVPARSLFQRRASVSASPAVSREMRASLMPAATRAALPGTPGVSTLMSPLLRARLALSLRLLFSTASHWPSNTSVPPRPAPFICGPASSSTQAMGSAVIFPAVTSSPGRQRTGCHDSVACEGGVLEAVLAGAVKNASPAPLSSAPPVPEGVHFRATGARVASRHAPLPSAGSSTLRLNCLIKPFQADSPRGVLLFAGFNRPPSAATCRA